MPTLSRITQRETEIDGNGFNDKYSLLRWRGNWISRCQRQLIAYRMAEDKFYLSTERSGETLRNIRHSELSHFRDILTRRKKLYKSWLQRIIYIVTPESMAGLHSVSVQFKCC